jgi:hypothetical protein
VADDGLRRLISAIRSRFDPEHTFRFAKQAVSWTVWGPRLPGPSSQTPRRRPGTATRSQEQTPGPRWDFGKSSNAYAPSLSKSSKARRILVDKNNLNGSPLSTDAPVMFFAALQEGREEHNGGCGGQAAAAPRGRRDGVVQHAHDTGPGNTPPARQSRPANRC